MTAFQQDRGLHPSGRCDEVTWLALVEASWKLGDRLLVLTAPQLRGDDVETLQRSLNHVGFDCGRPDGILGPATVAALIDFQRNCGITPDGICGTTTIRTLELLRRQSGSGPGVASVRESEAASRVSDLATSRIVVGQFGGLSSIARAVARALREQHATVISTDEYEPAAQAAAANRFGATLYLGFEARPYASTSISYFAVPAFESLGGRSIATHLANELGDALPGPADVRGMRLPVLRETRMPAILCSLGPVRDVVDATDTITDAVVAATARWVRSPLPLPDRALADPDATPSS